MFKTISNRTNKNQLNNKLVEASQPKITEQPARTPRSKGSRSFILALLNAFSAFAA